MAQVETLRGAIDTSKLGFTLMHDHIFVHPEGLVENFPSVWDKKKQVASARKKLREAHAIGVDTIVDPTVLGLGRNIPLIRKVVGNLPINVIVTTGIYYSFDLATNWFRFKEIDDITDFFIRDIKEGIQGTNVKAGVVKAASDVQGITPTIEKYMRAAARAHRRTGIPLFTHSEAHLRQGLQQQDILKQEGVDLSRVIIGHSGDSEDIDYLKSLMDKGSFIGMDRFGQENYLPDAKRVAVVTELCKMGYTGQMVLGHDSGCYTTYMPWEMVLAMFPNSNLQYISKDVLPALRASGVSEDQIRQMTVKNPRRVFENSRPY